MWHGLILELCQNRTVISMSKRELIFLHLRTPLSQLLFLSSRGAWTDFPGGGSEEPDARHPLWRVVANALISPFAPLHFSFVLLSGNSLNTSVLCTVTWPLSCLKKCISSSDLTAHDPHRLPYCGAQYGLCWPLRGLHGTSQGAGGLPGVKMDQCSQLSSAAEFIPLLCRKCPYL